MSNELPHKQIIDAALSQIGSVADVNTVIGEPVSLPGGITVIPFSKVSVGFASGGADYDGKKSENAAPPHFAGANGAGVSVTPLGFLVIDSDGVRMLDLKHAESFSAANDPVSKALNSLDAVIEKAPDIAAKIKEMFAKRKKEPDIDKQVADALEKTRTE